MRTEQRCTSQAEKTIADHPASEGWKVFCFSHAPIIGSGLRVLQERLLLDGCYP